MPRNASGRVGRVDNGESNYLALIVIDAAHASKYRGIDSVDYERAMKAIERGRSQLRIGEATAVAVEIGGCGMAEVHRLGDAIVIPEHYTGDNDAASEAALDHAIAATPTTKPARLGKVEVTSGELAFVGMIMPGTKRCFRVKVPPGSYAVWREEFDPEVRGVFGSIPSRVRVVPADTRVVAGKPILDVSPPVARASVDGLRRVVEWAAIKSLAIANDGRMFAGENGNFRVAAWNADGTSAWERAIAKPGKSKFFAEVWIQLVGDDLLAMARGGNEVAEIQVLDPATGRTRRTLKIPSASAYRVAGDRLLLATDETTVLSYPKLKRLAQLTEYTSKLQLAVSPDGKWLAASGSGTHVYDFAKLAHVRTIETDADPYAVAFTAKELVIGDTDGYVGLYEPKTGKRLAHIDAAPERKRRPSIVALASSAKHIAAGRNDGTAVVIDRAKKRIVHTFENHTAAKSSIGANALDGVAFSADGKTLWVTGTPKGKPIGLTGYAV